MAFEVVYVYNQSGALLGATIKQDSSKKLHTENLWNINDPTEAQDLRDQLSRLVDNTDVRAFWPQVQDPEVQALLGDDTFEPLELHPVEVMDEDNSLIVWDEEPSDDNPYGRMNKELSVIVNKTTMAPAPAEVKRRTMKACEIIARRRAQQAQGG